MFAGTVLSVRRGEARDRKVTFLTRLVTLDVERSFLNAPTGRVEVVTGSGGGDCGYAFEEGRKYLVYAWKRSGSYATGICSRTRPLEEADEDVRYLTALPDARAGASVFGRVSHWQREPSEDRPIDRGPIEGVVVSLRGDGVARNVTTDANGRFEFAGLGTGQLRLVLVPPPGFDSDWNERSIHIRHRRGCSEQDFVLTQKRRKPSP